MRTERPRLFNLVMLVTLSAGLLGLLNGAAFWAGAVLLVAVTAFGSLSFLATLDPRGVPVESLATPAAAALSVMGLTHIAGPGLLGMALLVPGALLVASTLEVETGLVGSASEAHARRRGQLVPLMVLLAFLAFTTVSSVVYGALDDKAGTSGPASLSLDEGRLLLLVGIDALVAFALGYRLAGARSASVLGAARAGGTFAVVIGVAAALTRAIALPRILGPALLAAVFYLWSAYRSASGVERRSAAWLWEYAVLAGAAALAVAWTLLLR
ncbi:MAG: hypothetical protein ACR2JZ_04005 [Candidatus Limnocylindrales bacterium]